MPPKTAALKNSSSRRARALALRELEASTGFLLAVFLALDHARVAGEEALALQRRPEIRLVIGERLGEAVTHRAGLSREATAGNRHGEIVLAMPLRDGERLLQDHPQHGTGEIDLDRFRVDDDLAGAGPDPDARHRILALARGIGAALLVELLHIARRFGRGYGIGGPQVLEGGKNFGHGNQALRLFLRFKAATSSTTGFCASCGWLAPL